MGRSNHKIITVIGTANVGKSTFIQDILNTYSFTRLHEAEYRKLKDISFNRDGNTESQDKIFESIYNQLESIDEERSIAEQENPESKEINIFDRSIIDALVYTKYLSDKQRYTNDIKKMEEKVYCCLLAKKYDNIFYIPLERCKDIEVVTREHRDTNQEYREAIDNLFKYYIKEMKIPVQEIYGNRMERIDKFNQILLQENFI